MYSYIILYVGLRQSSDAWIHADYRSSIVLLYKLYSSLLSLLIVPYGAHAISHARRHTIMQIQSFQNFAIQNFDQVKTKTTKNHKIVERSSETSDNCMVIGNRLSNSKR